MDPVTRSSSSRFILTLLIFSVLAGVVLFLLSGFIPVKYFSTLYPFILAFYFAESLIVHLVISKSVEKKPIRFVNRFMMITGVKLMVYLVIMVVYAVVNKEEALGFIIIFFALYLFYTPLQVIFALKLVKRQ